jgi:cell wall-associated NlpC family hydrolase
VSDLDKRLNAFRDELADVQLQGRVVANRYVEGEAAHCVAPVSSIRKQPADDAMQITQLLLGENVLLFERSKGWAWVKSTRDGYVGYVREGDVVAGHLKATHHVATPLAHRFPKADLKTQPAVAIPMNAALKVTGQEGDYLAVAGGGYVYSAHTSAAPLSDFVAVAEQFLHTPYLWGGKSWAGLDCSGLVQIAMHACGMDCLRDSDMQEQSLGVSIDDRKLQRGDLVFWKGHVGIMQTSTQLLHANGHHLKVVSEPLLEARARIAAKGSIVTSIKRLQ